MKYWFKECPKCNGDLRQEADRFGAYVACMQCGYTLKHTEEVHLRLNGTLKQMMVVPPAKR